VELAYTTFHELSITTQQIFCKRHVKAGFSLTPMNVNYIVFTARCMLERSWLLKFDPLPLMSSEWWLKRDFFICDLSWTSIENKVKHVSRGLSVVAELLVSCSIVLCVCCLALLCNRHKLRTVGWLGGLMVRKAGLATCGHGFDF